MSTNTTLMYGDCLELMPRLKSHSVDMILCDLPYGTTGCKWDSVIPFEPLWREYKRLIKPSGAIVLFGSQPFTSRLVMSQVDLFKYCLVWEKERATNFLNFKYQFGKSHEDIVVFSKSPASYTKKGNHMNYYPQMVSGAPYTQKQGRAGHAIARDERTRNNSVTTRNRGQRYPKSVLRYKTEKGLHPTQKPVPLLEYLIKSYTNENDTVLDNCMGSGSTGVAAQNLSRGFVGIELDKIYFDTATERMAKRGDQ